jgi:hypothetical protein
MTVYLATGGSHQLGYFEFRLCADKKLANDLMTQDFFIRHLLELAD